MEAAAPAKRIRLDIPIGNISEELPSSFSCFGDSSESLHVSAPNSLGVVDSTCDSGFNELTPPRYSDEDLTNGSSSHSSHGVKRSISTSDEDTEVLPLAPVTSTKLNGHHLISTNTSILNNPTDVPQEATTHNDRSPMFRNNADVEEGCSQQSNCEEDEDDNQSVCSNSSHISGLSHLDNVECDDEGGDRSGGGGAGPAYWVQQQMRRGQDPRSVLCKILGGRAEDIPANVSDEVLWRFLVNVLTSDSPPRRERLRHLNTIQDAVRLIKTSKKIIVLTGAGVSVSCGIPDFRSRDGIYARLAVDFPNLPDPQAMFDIHFFRKDPRPFFKFAREIYPGQFTPSLCHRFIKCIESHKKLLRNYTQNIDTLEQEAGINNVIQCHGSFATATCQQCNYKVKAEAIKDDIFEQRIPMCPRCSPPGSPEAVTPQSSSPSHNSFINPSNNTENQSSNEQSSNDPLLSPEQNDITQNNNNNTSIPSSSNCSPSNQEPTSYEELEHDISADDDMDDFFKNTDDLHDFNSQSSFSRPPQPIMKPDIVFFGEGLPDEFHDNMAIDKDECDLLIVIGSSLKVRPVALIPSSLPSHVPQILINREPLTHLTFDIELLGDCDVIVNELCHRLGGDWTGVSSDPQLLNEITELPPRLESSSLASQSPPQQQPQTGSTSPSTSTTSVANAPHPKDEQDIEALRACWAPKVKESVAARLPENAFLFNGGHRYVFKGAEVYYDPDDNEEEDDASSVSSEIDDELDSPNILPLDSNTTKESNLVPAVTEGVGVDCMQPSSQSTTGVGLSSSNSSNSIEDIVKAVEAMEDAAVVALANSVGVLRGAVGCRSGSCETYEDTSGDSSSSSVDGASDEVPSPPAAPSNSEAHADDWMTLQASLDSAAFVAAGDRHDGASELVQTAAAENASSSAALTKENILNKLKLSNGAVSL